MNLLGAILLVGLAVAGPETEGLDEDARKNVRTMANDFASCAGVWDFIASVEQANGRPTSAKQAKETANGAFFAATWLASQVHHLENPKDRKPYGDFNPMFEGRRESGQTHMLAMLEREDLKGAEERMKFCASLLETQEEIINEVRQTFVK